MSLFGTLNIAFTFVGYKSRVKGLFKMGVVVSVFVGILVIITGFIEIHTYVEKRNAASGVEKIASTRVVQTISATLNCGEIFKFLPQNGFFSVEATRPVDLTQEESSCVIEPTDKKMWVTTPALETEVKSLKCYNGPTVVSITY